MSTQANIAELAALVRAKRGSRGLRAVAHEIGNISPSTLSRVEQGKVPDLDTFLRLCHWLDVSPERFVLDDSSNPHGVPDTADTSQEPSTLAIVTAHLRADRMLAPETAEALATMIRLAYEASARGEFEVQR